MILTIVAPCGTLCSTTTDRVTFPGTVGRFTVLKGHAPLIAGLAAGEIVYATAGEDARLRIKNGCVRVFEDRIEACVETADEMSGKGDKLS
ncbi:hypothetical protein [uncultured Alistipes sp.]|uniref:hypothetical protein n=1 Tax=uncultured Alistipes sp. TaxID=538949 RepID=UPI002803F5EC|nr:hypothetical protein [uncultured Alistipes sp.]